MPQKRVLELSLSSLFHAFEIKVSTNIIIQPTEAISNQYATCSYVVLPDETLLPFPINHAKPKYKVPIQRN